MSDEMLQFLGGAFGTDHPAFQAHPNTRNRESIDDLKRRFKEGEFVNSQTKGALLDDAAILISAGVTSDQIPEDIVNELRRSKPEIFVAASEKSMEVKKDNANWASKQFQEHKKFSQGLLSFAEKFDKARTLKEMEEAFGILDKLKKEIKSSDLQKQLEQKMIFLPDKNEQVGMVITSNIQDIKKEFKKNPTEENARRIVSKLEKLYEEVKGYKIDIVDQLTTMIRNMKNQLPNKSQ